MFNFKFGAAWTVVFTAIFGASYYAFGGQINIKEVRAIALGLFILFESIGIFLMITGAWTVYNDKSTEKRGEISYGRIIKVYPSGAFVNGEAELVADIAAYIPNKKRTKLFSEIIGFDPKKYIPGMYLRLKQHANDVSIVEIVEESEVPNEIVLQIKSNFIVQAEKPIEFLFAR